jgi:hypothetical protein
VKRRKEGWKERRKEGRKEGREWKKGRKGVEKRKEGCPHRKACCFVGIGRKGVGKRKDGRKEGIDTIIFESDLLNLFLEVVGRPCSRFCGAHSWRW